MTLQTGLSLRQDLQLSDEVLAILVGGGGIRQLFEIGEQHKTKMTQVQLGAVNQQRRW